MRVGSTFSTDYDSNYGPIVVRKEPPVGSSSLVLIEDVGADEVELKVGIEVEVKPEVDAYPIVTVSR